MGTTVSRTSGTSTQRDVHVQYKAFARGDESKFSTFEEAVLRHQLIEELYTSFEEGRAAKAYMFSPSFLIQKIGGLERIMIHECWYVALR